MSIQSNEELSFYDMTYYNKILCIANEFLYRVSDKKMIEYFDKVKNAPTTSIRKKFCDLMYEYLFSVEMLKKKELAYKNKNCDDISNKPLVEVVFAYYRYYEPSKQNIYMLHESFDFINLMREGKVNKKRWMTLITAYCQSGKTFLIISAIAMYLALGMTAILIVKDKGNKRQVMSRVKEDFKKLRAFLTIYGYEKESKMYKNIVYYDSESNGTAKNFMDTKLKPALSGNYFKHRLIICIKHDAHLKRVNECLMPSSIFALFIDEAHILGGYKQVGNGSGTDIHDSCVAYERELFKLKESPNCKKLVEITATSQSILVSNPYLYAKGVLHIETELCHRSLKDVIFNTEYHENDKKYEDETEWIPSLKSFLFEKSMSPPYERTNKFGKDDILAIHVLIKHDRLNERQNTLLNAFKDDAKPYDDYHFAIIKAKWVVMTMQAEGIRLYHSSLQGMTINIGKESIKDKDNGEFLFKNIEICDILQWLELNGSVERFPRRAIISYACAEEGITFAGYYSTDPNIDKNLHLTDLYISMNKISPGCRLRQSIERGSGNHGDDMKINIYCSEKNKIKWIKTTELHDQQIDYLRSLARNGDEQVIKAISRQEIFSNRVPAKYIKVPKGDKIIKKKNNPKSKVENDVIKKTKNGITALNTLNSEKYQTPVITNEQLIKNIARAKIYEKKEKEIKNNYFTELETWKDKKQEKLDDYEEIQYEKIQYEEIQYDESKIKVDRNKLSIKEQETYDMVVEYIQSNNHYGWVLRRTIASYMIKDEIGSNEQVYSRLQKIITPEKISTDVTNSGLMFKNTLGRWWIKYICE